MRRKFKRLTAFLLSAAMVFPFFGEYPSGTFDFDWGFDWSVSAEDTTPDFSTAKVLTAVDGVLYIDGDSVSTIPAGDYKLESDITTNIHVFTEGSINIDLNGHTWNMSDKNLRIANDKTEALTIRSLTHKNPTMQEMFKTQRELDKVTYEVIDE